MLLEEKQKLFLLKDKKLKEYIRKYGLPKDFKYLSDFNLFLKIDEASKIKIIICAEGICFELKEIQSIFEFNKENKVVGHLEDEELCCPVLLSLGIGQQSSSYEAVFKVYHIYKNYDTHYIDSYECLLEDYNFCYDCRKLFLTEVILEDNIVKTKAYITSIKIKDEFQNNEEVFKLVLNKNNDFKGFINNR